MARGPLIPGLREYDAPRRRRSPVFWMWTIGAVVAVVALVVLGGLVAVASANPQRHGHVVLRAEFGQEVVELVDKTQVTVAPLALLGSAERREQLALQLHAALRGRIQPAQQMQERALARARSAHNRQRLPGVDFQVHALQHGHIQAAFGETLGQALGF